MILIHQELKFDEFLPSFRWQQTNIPVGILRLGMREFNRFDLIDAITKGCSNRPEAETRLDDSVRMTNLPMAMNSIRSSETWNPLAAVYALHFSFRLRGIQNSPAIGMIASFAAAIFGMR